MNRTIKTLLMTEKMYDYFFKEMKIDQHVDIKYHLVTSAEEWSELLSDDENFWKYACHHWIYECGDSTYILTRPYAFGGTQFPDYGTRINENYWYIFKFNSTEKITETEEESKKEAVSGASAIRKVYAQIKKNYSVDEIKEIINKHGYQAEEKPKHFDIFKGTNETKYSANQIHTFTNTAYYDINKAYAANLMTFFPKLKTWMKNNYKKNKSYFKKIINYAVGFFQRLTGEKDTKIGTTLIPAGLNFRLLRNAIVHNTNMQMNQAFAELDDNKSELIYVNTDGFIINNPPKEINWSEEIGDFGKEIVDNNTVKILKFKSDEFNSYGIMQWYENGEKVIKSLGGFKQQDKLIKHIDLFKKKTVIWTEDTVIESIDRNGKRHCKKVINERTIKELILNE